MVNLKTTVAGVEFKNPIIAASGTFGFGREYNSFYDVGVLGGICSKGLTLEPRQGNDPVRIAETPSGMLNSVGLQNPGVMHFIEEELPFMKSLGTVVIANAAGSTESDYIKIVGILSDSDVDMIELNISCPNV
ncbi:MAG: dihydroorotate dehydrogenase, partial [Clostridia bacterium]|nr:dihydroorotate dehydrogenase [Clostridia bacterium]